MAKPGLRRQMLRLAAVLLLLAACDRDDDDGAGASCDDLAEHVERICGEGLGSITAASLRHDCATFGNTPHAKRCVLAADSCDEDSLGACDIHNRHWVCEPGTGASDCPPGLMCNDEDDEAECVECRADEDCDAAELCLSGWCVRDTDTNRQLQGVLD
jgi:hypothetical protein